MDVLGEVPAGDAAGDDEVLAGDAELRDPEPAQQVVPAQPVQLRVRHQRHVRRRVVHLALRITLFIGCHK